MMLLADAPFHLRRSYGRERERRNNQLIICEAAAQLPHRFWEENFPDMFPSLDVDPGNLDVSHLFVNVVNASYMRESTFNEVIVPLLRSNPVPETSALNEGGSQEWMQTWAKVMSSLYATNQEAKRVRLEAQRAMSQNDWGNPVIATHVQNQRVKQARLRREQEHHVNVIVPDMNREGEYGGVYMPMPRYEALTPPLTESTSTERESWRSSDLSLVGQNGGVYHSIAEFREAIAPLLTESTSTEEESPDLATPQQTIRLVPEPRNMGISLYESLLDPMAGSDVRPPDPMQFAILPMTGNGRILGTEDIEDTPASKKEEARRPYGSLELITCETLCVICTEAMQNGNVVHRLECRHRFHLHCLSTWSRRGDTCPICREQLPALEMW